MMEPVNTVVLRSHSQATQAPAASDAQRSDSSVLVCQSLCELDAPAFRAGTMVTGLPRRHGGDRRQARVRSELTPVLQVQ